ncbi:PQQ-binding-like beta-propeller repeat protein [Gordonia zhaorongruii]|uniref:PQQ-binding-like beta-propeller repeat protein n=1 Tax=Gordonia zhaorongruii TaxID=2597659 RepID=UPI00104314BD|nr:PQQ-binding-like beta-propeller repeat protein [Gordonia zhaorongruii]
MSIRSAARRLPFGMGTVAAAGAVAMAVSAGIVLAPGSGETPGHASHGELRDYASAPVEQWTIDHTSMPGLTGDGDITVADTHGDDWLVSYSAGIRHEYLLVDAATGVSRWKTPVDAGFGACAFDAQGGIGCAVRMRTDGPDNGFYRIDRGSGSAARMSEGSDTAELVGLGSDFLHVNDTGYQVSRQTETGDVVWQRTFAATATARYQDAALVVETTDGNRFVLDPETGDDIVTCESCTVDTYPTGILMSRTNDGRPSVAFHPLTNGEIQSESAHTADGLRVLSGPSVLPVLTSGGDQVLDAHGRYQVMDPATGDARWQVSDPELSKVHARPCGPQVSFARKDRSRVFFRLDDGSRLGELPPPAFDAPDANIDVLSCVGSSDDIAVFGNRNQLTAFAPSTGAQAWTLPINGEPSVIDGRIVLRQGSTLSVLR